MSSGVQVRSETDRRENEQLALRVDVVKTREKSEADENKMEGSELRSANLPFIITANGTPDCRVPHLLHTFE